MNSISPVKTVPREKLQRLLLEEIKRDPECSGVRSIRVYGAPDGRWTPVGIDFGGSDGLECLRALKSVVTKFQEEYRVVEGKA